VLRHLEESGRIRRGYFVSGVGAMQFAQPGVLDLLRSLREPPEAAEVVTLAATDPANPYGALLEWPAVKGAPEGKRPARSVGASVVLVDGELAAHVSRGARQLFAWLPEFEPERSHLGAAVAAALTDLVRALHARDQAALVVEIDGGPAVAHPLAGYLHAAGFVPTAAGLQLTRRAAAAASFSAGGGS
ncbi:MAG TPA: DEAD/DEAH box helicase, partial [Anaeromyxobacter sp.]|nr:DEAD/DEAH box helicase [Anaeromyxobacter sp.]